MIQRFLARFFFPISFALLLITSQVFCHQAIAEAEGIEQQPKPISYEVDFLDSHNHYLHIQAEIPVEKNTTELMMAVWTPGSYLIREYARHIDSFSITSDEKTVPYKKTRKNRWTVDTEGCRSIRVSYRLYCNEMSVRTNWVGRKYAMINGAPTFVTVAGRLDQPHQIRLKLPDHWSRSATSLRSSSVGPHVYLASNFDELVDSPIVAGNIRVYPFTVGGVTHQLVNVGETGIWNGTKAANDLEKIVAAHHEMWQTIPYDRYLFLNMICESGGGLEHDFSTLIMTSRWSFRDKGRYQSWLSLASHEFFHTWNVRRLRPKSLVKYDYENEVYTPSLWVAEGITSYYEDLLLVRAGLIDDAAYLSRLSQNIESVQRTNGRRLQSLRDSSFDTWIKFYRPDENSSNTRISYYSKGAVAAFLLDAKIRKLTGGKKSLDDVMRKLYELHSESGYTAEDFQEIAGEVSGQDLSKWFEQAIDSTDELDYSDIEFLGVTVPALKDKPVAKTETPDESDKTSSDVESEKENGVKETTDAEPNSTNASESVTNKIAAAFRDSFNSSNRAKASITSTRSRPSGRPWIGVSASNSDGKLTVSRVTPDSPGAEAGLNTDDEIIAINDYRIGSSLDSRIKQYKSGDTLEFLIARRGMLMTLEITIGNQVSQSWRLKFISKPSKSQQRQKSNWLSGSKNTSE